MSIKNELHSEWVSLREAASILGVHPATVRNWADRGGLPAQRTPGGHRRFRRSDLYQWSVSRQTPPTAEMQVIIQGTLGRARLFVDEHLRDDAWYQTISGDARLAMRETGHGLLEALQNYLGDPSRAPLILEDARRLAGEYGRLLSAQGLSMSQALRSFLYFINLLNDTVINVIELSALRTPGEWLGLLRRVRGFTDTLLVGLAEYYEKTGH